MSFHQKICLIIFTNMNYVLITSDKEQIYFYILSCAEIYQLAFGGEIVKIEEHESTNRKESA